MNGRRAVASAVAIVAIYTAACAKDLSALEPFPCATDGTCPAGLACVAGTGCVTPKIDTPCVKSTDCSKASRDAACLRGACVTICERTPCPAGRVCVRATLKRTDVFGTSSSEVAGCMRACDAEACPAGLTCVELGTGEKVCTDGTAPDYVPVGSPCLDGECPGHDGSVKCVFGGTCAKDGCPCEDGFVCSRRDGVGGVCLPDCTVSGTCANGSICKSLRFDGKKACMAPASSVSGCIAVENGKTCPSFECGVSGKRPSCSGNCNTLPDGTCPLNANESAFFGCANEDPPRCHCMCSPGFTGVDCEDGTSCNSNNCQGKLWGCKRTTQPSCADDTDGFSGTCVCRDGRRVGFACGGGTTCEERCLAEP